MADPDPGPAVDLDAAVAAGLLEPESPSADERRQLLEFLIGEGCTIDEMVSADLHGRLFALAGDKILRPGRDTYALDEAAAMVGLDVDLLRQVWRALGLHGATENGPVVSPAELEVLRILPTFIDAIGEVGVLDLFRTVGLAVGQIAEAGAAVVRSSADLSVETSGSELVTATFYAGQAIIVPWFGQLLDVCLRHHVEAARMQFEESGSYDLIDHGLIRLAVGFVDVTGYTAASSSMEPAAIARLVRAFELSVSDATKQHGGRIVKFIGDAAMFVAPNPTTVAEVASTLVAQWADHPDFPGMSVRGGLAAGELISREGDFFGAPVNLAARLVALAPPRSILADATVIDGLPDERWTIGERQSLEVRGLADPVSAAAISGSGG